MPRGESALVTAVLTGLVAITPLSIDMPLPALPRLAQAFATDVARAQLLISTFLVGFAAAQLVYGPLSDRFGRRAVLLGGVGLYLAASVACAWAPSIEWLLAGRLVQGLGACVGPVVARAAVRDVHAGARAARILSVIATGASVAPILAPVIGGLVLLVADWRAIFAVLAASGALLLAGVWSLVAETNASLDRGAARPGRLLRNYATIAADRAFAAYALTVAAGACGLFAFISGAPFVLIDGLGLAPHEFGLFFATVMLGQISGALLSSRLTVRLGIDATMRVGLGGYILGGLAMAALALGGVAHVAAVVGPMALFMLGNGMVMPNGMAGAIIPFPRMAGAASALAGFIQMTAGALAGAAVGRLHDGTPLPMAAMIAGAGVLAAAALRPGRR